MAELAGRRQKLFWFVYILLLLGFAYVTLRFLGQEVYTYAFWRTLLEDIDHRYEPYEQKDINGDGIRSKREADEFVEQDFNIVFSGDSYTYGFLLSSQQSPPMQFEQVAREKLPQQKIKVANFGWSTSSPFLSLRLLKDKAKKYKPDLVVFILDITDFKDDWFYRGVAEKRENYQFLTDNKVGGFIAKRAADITQGYTDWHEQLMGYPNFSNYFVAHQPYEKSLPLFEHTYEMLLQMHEFVTSELGAKFVVFVPPRHWQYTDAEAPKSRESHQFDVMGPYALNHFRFVESKHGESPFPFISLLDDFKNTDVYPTTFENDSHWNPQGATFVAETMLHYCLQLNCFE